MTPAAHPSDEKPRFGLARLTALPLWGRLILLTGAGLISLIGLSVFFSSVLDQTVERTTRMTGLFEIVGAAGEAHVAFGQTRYWLSDLAVSQLVLSERNAIAARQKLDADLERIAAYDLQAVAEIRGEVDAYVKSAMNAADAYTDGNRVIGNTLLAQARAHSAKVDETLANLVAEVQAAALAERQIVVERAQQSARTGLYIVIAVLVIGLVLTILVFRSIVHPLRRLNDAIAGLMEGRYDVEIPPEGDHEFGAIARTLRLFRDSTIERNRLEVEAEQQRNTIDTAIETISDGFVLFDKDAHLLLANSKYREMFPEIAPIVRPGVSFREIQEIRVANEPALTGRLAKDEWIDQEVAKHNDAADSVDERRYRETWVRITKRQTPDGGKVAVFTDITDLKEREAAITGARDEAKAALADLQNAQKRLVQAEKMASLGQLTAGIAHEIKNPLNFVNNFAKLSDELLGELADILDEPIKALDADERADAEELLGTVRENLAKVAEHGNRADSIVKNMLLHSRDGPSEVQTVNLNAIVEEALNLAYHGARAENSSFNIDMVKELADDVGEIECFSQDLLRVFLNLINNGMYAAYQRSLQSENDSSPSITVTTQAAGESVVIEVKDNGLGIPPDVRENIFSPFFTTKPAGEGTGLGLSLSHDIIVKQHIGELTVESEPGEFTAFRVIVPKSHPENGSVS